MTDEPIRALSEIYSSELTSTGYEHAGTELILSGDTSIVGAVVSVEGHHPVPSFTKAIEAVRSRGTEDSLRFIAFKGDRDTARNWVTANAGDLDDVGILFIESGIAPLMAYPNTSTVCGFCGMKDGMHKCPMCPMCP